MKDSFDRGIKQKLEDLTPEELGYRPDREKIWGKIAQKKKAKIIPFPSWITHAAAVAAGLLIGAFFLNRHHQDPESKSVVASPKSIQSLPQKVTIRTDTVYVLQAAEEQQKKKAAGRVTATAVYKQQQPQESFITQKPIDKKITEEVIPAPTVPSETAAATIAATQHKVLHLSDMDNENSIPKPKPKNLAFFKIFSNSSQPEDHQATLSMLVGQRLAASKN